MTCLQGAIDPETFAGSDWDKINAAQAQSAVDRVPVLVSRPYDLDNTLTGADNAELHFLRGGGFRQIASLAHLISVPSGRHFKITGHGFIDCNGLGTNYAVNLPAPQESVIDGLTFTNHKAAIRTTSQATLATFKPVIKNIHSLNPVVSTWNTILISTPVGRPATVSPVLQNIRIEGLYGDKTRGDQLVVQGADDAFLEDIWSGYGGENGISISNACRRPVLRRITCVENDKHGLDIGSSKGYVVLDNTTGLGEGETITQPGTNPSTAVVDKFYGGRVFLKDMHTAFTDGATVTWPGGSGVIREIGSVQGARLEDITCNGNGIDAGGSGLNFGGLYFQSAYDCDGRNIHSFNNPFAVYAASSHVWLTNILASGYTADLRTAGQATINGLEYV